MPLKERIESDMKAALRGGDKLRLTTLRMLIAAIKQREIDERRGLDNNDLLAIVGKQIKQRRESAAQFADGGRPDLEQQEISEAEILQTYLPEPLSEAEIEALVNEVIAATGAAGMRDMGKVMAAIRPKVQGRADMSALSALVKGRLSG